MDDVDKLVESHGLHGNPHEIAKRVLQFPDTAPNWYVGAAITLAAALTEVARERDALREALESIRIYGSDTLSGRVDGPDDRQWQRESVLEMTRRARAALGASQ